MDVEFVRESGTNYMKIQAVNATEKFQMKMVIENTIDNIISTSERIINGTSVYLYDISSKINISSIYENTEIDGRFMEKLVGALHRVIERLGDYFLDAEGLVLELDKIYVDNRSEEIYFSFFSGQEKDFCESARCFFEQLLRLIDHTDSRAVAIAYGVYKRVCEENFDIKSVFEFEEKERVIPQVVEERTIYNHVMPQTVVEEEERPDKTKQYIILGASGIIGIVFLIFFIGIFAPAFRIGGMGRNACLGICIILTAAGYYGYRTLNKYKDALIKVVRKNKQEPFEKREVKILVPPREMNDEKTVILSNIQNNAHYLKWEDGSGIRKYQIDEDVCVIGSQAEKADCIIPLPGVSRMHARISKEGDAYYIKDLSSSNGTWVNGKELAGYEMVQVKPNDHIVFGNVECVFV